MKLKMWSTDQDLKEIHPEDTVEMQVVSREAATAILVRELATTASEKFTHDALAEWFSTGRISGLSEFEGEFTGTEVLATPVFWNVSLTD